MYQILQVEDEAKVAAFVRRGLEERDYKVKLAATGTEAQKLLLRTEKYDLIILDVMP